MTSVPCGTSAGVCRGAPPAPAGAQSRHLAWLRGAVSTAARTSRCIAPQLPLPPQRPLRAPRGGTSPGHRGQKVTAAGLEAQERHRCRGPGRALALVGALAALSQAPQSCRRHWRHGGQHPAPSRSGAWPVRGSAPGASPPPASLLRFPGQSSPLAASRQPPGLALTRITFTPCHRPLIYRPAPGPAPGTQRDALRAALRCLPGKASLGHESSADKRSL